MAIAAKPTDLKAWIDLQAALAADPDVATEQAALRAACDRFDFVQSKIPNTSSSQYQTRVRAAKTVVTELQAKFDVGTLDADTLNDAKRELKEAKEALELAPGRRKVIVDELEVAALAIQGASDALQRKLGLWSAKVTEARNRLEREATQLLFAAAEANRLQGSEIAIGRIAHFAAALPHASGDFGGDTQFLPLPIDPGAKAAAARNLVESAERRQDRLVEIVTSPYTQLREADIEAGIDRDELVKKAQQLPPDPSLYEHRVGRQSSGSADRGF